jgi:hypothetical protein
MCRASDLSAAQVASSGGMTHLALLARRALRLPPEPALKTAYSFQPLLKADDAAANNDASGQAEAADKAAGAVVEPAESNGAAAMSEPAAQDGASRDDADKQAAEGGKVVCKGGPVGSS